MTLQVVQTYAENWRTLRAWGAPLPAAIRTEVHKGQRVLGWASPGRCATVVRCTGDLARDLATVLHELAHLAAPSREGHGAVWKTMFARAAAEALDCDVDDFDTDVAYMDMDQQVIDMATVWLEGR